MYEVKKEYLQAIMQPSRNFTSRVSFKDREFTDNEVISIKSSYSIASSERFIIGGGYINSSEIELDGIIEIFEEDEVCKPYISLITDETSIEIPLGKFYISKIKINRNSKTTTLEVKDEMYRLNGAYRSQLTYPTTSCEVLQEILTIANLETTPTITFTDYPISHKLEKVTVREALVYLAQQQGSFVTFDRLGKLDFIKLKRTNRIIKKDNYYLKGLNRDEIKYRLTGITCDLGNDKLLSIGQKTGNVMHLKNEWLTQINIDRIYHEYRDFNFYPYDLKMQGDMVIECGDIASVEVTGDSYFNIPVFSHSIYYNGGLVSDLSAKAKSDGKGISEYKGSIARRVEYLDELVSKQGSIYLNDEEPDNSKNGDLWFKNHGGHVEMLEKINGEWIKKADSADIGTIVNTITTDEVIAKKLSVALANIIEINAKTGVIGDLDLSRVRIMDGQKEILAVRDGKLIVNLSDSNEFNRLSQTVSELESSIYQRTSILENIIQERVVQLGKKSTVKVPVEIKPTKVYDFKFNYIGDCEVYVVFEFKSDKRKYPYRYAKKQLDYIRFRKKVSSLTEKKILFSFKAPPEFNRSYILYRSKEGARIYDIELSQNSDSLTVDKLTKLRQDLDSFTISVEDNINATKADLKLKTDLFETKIADNKSELESNFKQKADELNLTISRKANASELADKVDKDNIISEINISTEGVRIKGDRIEIEGLLTAYKGQIGGFIIGKNDEYGSWWIQGDNNFSVGMGNGSNSNGQTAFWSNWGSDWGNPNSQAWYVKNDGRMVCGNTAVFKDIAIFQEGINAGNRIKVGLVELRNNDIYYNNSDKVVWWSQQNKFLANSSDIRLKTNIEDTKINAIDIISKIRLVAFDWKDEMKGHEDIGFIAQNLERIKNVVVEKGDGYKAVNYQELIPYLTKAIQELVDENKELKSRIEEIERRVYGINTD